MARKSLNSEVYSTKRALRASKRFSVSLRVTESFSAYLRGISELVAHYIVEKWIDAGWQEVADAWDVSKGDIDSHEQVVAAEWLLHNFPVHRHDPLSVKRRPA